MNQPRQVVVTGGASGIGAATVAAFEALGDEVTVLDRVTATGGVKTVNVDLSNPTSVSAAIEHLPEQIDVLCNVAGISGLAGPRNVFAINFFAVRQLTELVMPRLRKGGAVVSVASTSGWNWRKYLDQIRTLLDSETVEDALSALEGPSLNGYISYNWAKAAVIVWTNTVARQLAGHARANSVSPGTVATPLLSDFVQSMGVEELGPLQQIAGRDAAPEEIADVITLLASTQARWINGTDVVVDHGAEMTLTLNEAFADREPKLDSGIAEQSAAPQPSER